MKLSLKTGEKGFDRIKELTALEAIHQYSTLILVPSKNRDHDLTEEKILDNLITLENFIKT